LHTDKVVFRQTKSWFAQR